MRPVVGKARASTSNSSGRHPTETAIGGRCSLTRALELLAPNFTPGEAAAKIEQSIHEDDRFPLYCDDAVVKANIRAIANLVPKEPEGEDGHWTADILSMSSRLGWAPGAYTWELEVDAVLALIPQPDTRAEAAQATAISALEMAEAARAETEQARIELQAAMERMEQAEARLKAAEMQAEAEAMTPTDKTPRGHKRGRKPMYPFWRLEAAAFANEFFKVKKQKPTAREVAEHLQLKCDGWAPDEADIGRLLRFLFPE